MNSCTASVRSLITVALLLAVANAQKVGLRSKLGFGCFNCALKWNFDCPIEYLPFDCRCSRDDFLTTAMNCVQVHATGIDQVVAGYDYIRAQCHYWGSRSMSIEEMENIYEANIGRLVSPYSFNSSTTVAPGPVAVPSMMINKQLTAASDTKYHYHVGNCFGWGVIGYWGFIIAGAVVTNVIRIVNPSIYNVMGTGRVNWMRKHLTLPALIGSRHHNPWRLSKYLSIHAPTRGQALIIAGFIAINIAGIVSFLGVVGDTPIAFASKSDRILHYLANRTGIVAFAHIPLIVLFACRNNPFIPLTGWPYDTFMVYHRWAARLMAINAIIHGVAMYWTSLVEKVVMYKWRHVHNWRGGNISVYMVIFMLCMALRQVRLRWYEVFKATHILMFLIFIICLIVHCSDYGWLGWLWAALSFYGGEYFARIARVILSGGIQEAEFTLASEKMYRVRIKGQKRRWAIKPGAYVYIRVFDSNLFWQSHPFSIFQSYGGRSDDSLDLCCKAQMGATRNLLQKIIASPEKKLTRKVLIEGPYGNENYVCEYDSVLLFAGGVGFTAMYSFASKLVERLKPGQDLNMIWVVKDCNSVRAFEEEVAAIAAEHPTRLKIFVTKPEEIDLGVINTSIADSPTESMFGASSEESSGGHRLTPITAAPVKVEPSDNGTSKLRSLIQDGTDSSPPPDACRILVNGDVLLNIDYGRPNVSLETSDFIRTARGSKAVCSCGPPMFVDAVRDAIVETIMDSEARVDYFEDAFSW